MAKSQGDGITILLGLKGYEVEKVSEDGKGIVVEVRAEPRGISSLIVALQGYTGMVCVREGRYFTVG